MANRGKELRKARQEKNDEFYTQLEDIEKEMKYYSDYFENKKVFCNCDDPYESNFFKYFAMNFNQLKLKKLCAICYVSSPIANKQLSIYNDIRSLEKINKVEKKAYKIEITEVKDENGDGAIDLADVEYLIKNKKNTLSLLEEDGSFESEESLELLKECDVVCTNPPFSRFRDFITLLESYKKDYLIIGNVNAIAYKEVFPLIKNNKLWLGCSIHSGDREFQVPDSYPLRATGTRIDENGNKFIRVKGVRWFTNIDNKDRHEEIVLYKKYNKEEYPTYDNFDAINVSSVSDIPIDYDGMMGVPITFMDKYNPNQFEIIGMGTGNTAKEIGVGKNYRGRTDLAITLPDGSHTCPFNRIIIRRKK